MASRPRPCPTRNDSRVYLLTIPSDGSIRPGQHDRHQVHSLMVWHIVDHEHIGQAAIGVARIGHTADEGDGSIFDAHQPVDGVHGPNGTRGVARDQPQKVWVLFLPSWALSRSDALQSPSKDLQSLVQV
jgi:hypothetical protein